MRALSISLGACLCLGLAVAWWASADDPAPPPMVDPFAEAASPTGPEAEPEAERSAPVDETDAVGAGDEAAPGDEAEREDGSIPLLVAEGGPSIVVVRGEPPVRVPGVELCFLGERELERRNREQDSSVNRFDGPGLFGRRVRTDANGEARLPEGRDRWLVTASHEGEFGFVAAWPRPREYTLRLELDEEVVLSARHADGAPAAVPVAVLQQRRAREAEPIWNGATDEDGRAVVRHLQLLRQPPPASGPDAPPERFAAIVTIPTEPATMVEFGGRPAQAEPVELRLPPLGDVLVQLVDFTGRPLLSPASVGFGIFRETEDPKQFPIGRAQRLQRAEKPVGPAPVRLPFVQVGRSLQVYARYPHERRPARSEEAAGPAEPGATVSLTVPPLASHVVLAGRLLQPGPVALGSSRVAAVLWRGDRAEQQFDVRTVADGSFDVVLQGRGEPEPFALELRFLAPASGDEVPARWLGATITPRSLAPNQRVELGDVVLRELPPLCAGVVVDDLGEPIAAATVRVQQEVPAPPQEAPRAGRGAPGRRSLQEIADELGRPAPRAPEWRPLPGLDVRTGDDGTFAIFGRMPNGALRVHADTDRHFADSVPLAATNQNLRIVIERNGIVRGRVLLPPWLSEGAVSISLRPLDEALRSSNTRTTQVSRRGGRFTLEPLRAGRYDALVTMRNLKEPLAVVPDVFVTPGVSQDRRLEPLDLRQALFRYRLTARDPAGQPLAIDGPIHARLQRQDGAFEEAGFRWQKGRAELITAHGFAELSFFGRGFRPERRGFTPGDHDVYLDALQPALVELPGVRALCGPTRKVRVSVILEGDTGFPASLGGIDQRSGERFSFPRWDLGRSSGGWLEQSDIVSIPLMQAGKYQVLLRPHATDTTNSPQASISLGTFELRPDGMTTTTVPIDSQAVLEALRRLDEQHRQQLERQQQRQRPR